VFLGDAISSKCFEEIFCSWLRALNTIFGNVVTPTKKSGGRIKKRGEIL